MHHFHVNEWQEVALDRQKWKLVILEALSGNRAVNKYYEPLKFDLVTFHKNVNPCEVFDVAFSVTICQVQKYTLLLWKYTIKKLEIMQ